MKLNHQILHWAAQTPDATAIQFGAQAISFSDLGRRADQAAAVLSRNFDVQPGDRVTYLGLNHPDMLVTLLACEQVGAIFNPLNTRLAPAEFAYLLSNAEPKLVLADANFFDTLNDLPESTGLLTASRAFAELAAEPLTRSDTGNDQPLLLVYTSGTTGHPKGVILNRDAVLANIENCQDLYRFAPGQGVQITLPLFHVGGLCILLLPALTHGATIHLHERFDPVAALQDIETHRPVTSIFVPAQMAAMMALPHWSEVDLSSLEYVVVGSSLIPLAQIQAFHQRNIPVSQIYGATETGPAAIGTPLPEAMRKEGSAGIAVRHCQIEVRDAERKPLAQGEHGDIWVKGPNILSHYWKNAGETAKVLVDDWYNTGDIGFEDADGFFWIVDRSKDVVISGGENIYPAEVEMASMRHPDISAIAVVGREHAKWGETPVAFVELVDGAELSLAEYQAFLAAHLAKFKHPTNLVVVEQLPRNSLGKVEKAVLRKRLASGS